MFIPLLELHWIAILHGWLLNCTSHSFSILYCYCTLNIADRSMCCSDSHTCSTSQQNTEPLARTGHTLFTLDDLFCPFVFQHLAFYSPLTDHHSFSFSSLVLLCSRTHFGLPAALGLLLSSEKRECIFCFGMLRLSKCLAWQAVFYGSIVGPKPDLCVWMHLKLLA